jgi:hypothetical protein
MSRAFVKEDAGGPDPRHRYPLPPPDDPGYDAAVARALLAGANAGDSMGAEEATGFRFGDPRLAPRVREILDEARRAGDDRLEQLAERFLRRAGADPDEAEPAGG